MKLASFSKFFVAVLSVVAVLVTSAQSVRAQTQDWEGRDWNCTGVNAGLVNSRGENIGEGVATIQGFSCLIANVLSVAITMIGVVAFLMFVVASFRYLLSGGSSKSTEMARSTMTYAVAGIVVALSSFIILNLIQSFTGINITDFVIPEAGVNP